MKNLLILFVSILAFSFLGATPNNIHNTKLAIKQLTGFEQAPVLIDINAGAELNIINHSVGDISSITISNVIGQVVLFENSIDKQVLDISSLSSGLYFIKIYYTDKTASIKKFYKNAKLLDSLTNKHINKFSLLTFKKDYNHLKFHTTKTEFIDNKTLLKNKSKSLKFKKFLKINKPELILYSSVTSKKEDNECQKKYTSSKLFTSNIGYSHNILSDRYLYI